MKRNLLVFLSAFVVSAAGFMWWLYTDMQRDLNAPMNLEASAVLDVSHGTGISGISRRLAREGWIEHPYYLILAARWRDQARLIKAGEYAVEPGLSQLELLRKMVEGRVIQYALTIPEGRNFAEIVTLVRNHPQLEQTLPEVEPAALAGHLPYLDKPPEGMFYPDTYHFPRGTTDREFFHRAYLHMQQVLKEEWDARDLDLPYENPYEALIMASIIEKETAVPAERDRIAGVFVRRLQSGMKLQTDPTVIYGLGEAFDGNLRKQDLVSDTPYNTYVRTGMPPTPIAMPGLGALHAALHPARTDALYFVAKGDGSSHFSKSLEEHDRAVTKYQKGGKK